MKIKILLMFILIGFNLSGQNEFNNWFFGVGNGLNFSGPIPTQILGSPMVQTEGVAAVSDATGGLLFYTNGVTVYNRLNLVMGNGTGLLGDGSSTQSSIIIQKPLSLTNYYIFTADADVGADGIRWSEVNMSLNGGLGGVTANKNILLRTPSCEKLCAVRHCNGKDIWIISHDWNSNVFTSWLIDGVNTPGMLTVWSISGTIVSGVNQSAYGQLKASSDGKRLGASYYGLPNGGTNRVEVYDFNNITGIVSNAITLTSTDIGPYGCEFSKSGRMLYATTNQGRLFQWDLCSPNPAASKVLITNSGPFFGSLQMANNGKIYISRGPQPFLCSINFPEIYGIGCGFGLNSVPLTGNAMFGLPNFPSYYQDPFISDITINQVDCNSFCFSYPSPVAQCGVSLLTYQWVFNDGTTQNGLTACKTFPSNQTVLFRIIRPCSIDSIQVGVTITGVIIPPAPIFHN